jgi:hypothetical protein
VVQWHAGLIPHHLRTVLGIAKPAAAIIGRVCSSE